MVLFTFCRITCRKKTRTLLIRQFSSSQRPAVSFDQSVEEESDFSKCKPALTSQKNPGAAVRGVVRLPQELRQAVDKLIADKSPSVLLREATKLKNHLDFKKPPLSQLEIDNIKSRCEQHFNMKTPPPDTTYLTEEDARKISNSRRSIIKRITEQNTYHWRPIVYDKSSALTYLVARLAPDYASLMYIFKELHTRDSQFQPITLLDFGSGVGSAIWAARSCWTKSVMKEIYCIDSSVAMNSLALALLQGGIWPNERNFEYEHFSDSNTNNSSLKGLLFRQYLPSSSAIKYDLVVSAHSLLELPSTEVRLQTALSLWRKSQSYLVFVEHGSRAAFEVLAEVREFLLSVSKDGKEKWLEGHVYAPCPHELGCPRISVSSPCNFEVKYEPLFTSRKDRLEKERYSYLILKKGPRPEGDKQWPRIVRPVLARSGHTICRLCTSKGTLEEIVVTRSKHNKQENLCARHSEWGDRLPVSLSWHSEEEEMNSKEGND